MADWAEFVRLIKKAACDAVEASKPCRIVFGEVLSGSPVSVRLEQRITLTEDFLIIPEYLTDHEVALRRSGVDTTYTHLNALSAGDKVILIQQKGGQKYLVLDRTV